MLSRDFHFASAAKETRFDGQREIPPPGGRWEVLHVLQVLQGLICRVIWQGWPFSLRLKFRGNPERFKGEGLRLAKDLSPNDAPKLTQELLFLSVLGEPLYIGKTEDIKVRFVAHHENGFLFKMKEQFKRPPSEFVLLAYFCEESRVRLIESILIQAINPPFCDQKC